MNCGIIQDLLPLYHDGVCSPESRTEVEEHLKTCPDCRAALAAMDAPLPEAEKAAPDDAAAVRSLSRAWEKGKRRAWWKGAVLAAAAFSVVISALVWVFARPLMALFVEGTETAIIAEGARYLRIEGAFYCGIGCLFLLYGLYRALGRPGMSVVLTVISLGTRVALAYALSAVPLFGVTGIWWSVPIGWALADITGFLYYLLRKRQLLSWGKTP